jgi:ferritin-like metal-binding protein YciE
MAVKNLHEAFVSELHDMLGAEKQIASGLRKMIRKAGDERVKDAFEDHLDQTEGQIVRLEKVLEAIGEKPVGKHCPAVAGIIDHGEQIIGEVDDSHTMDAVLIASAQKVEHYEIATYGTLCTWAERMDHPEALDLLKQNLREEKETDEKLTELAGQVNIAALPA